jgi:hypothetical protein
LPGPICGPPASLHLTHACTSLTLLPVTAGARWGFRRGSSAPSPTPALRRNCSPCIARPQAQAYQPKRKQDAEAEHSDHRGHALRSDRVQHRRDTRTTRGDDRRFPNLLRHILHPRHTASVPPRLRALPRSAMTLLPEMLVSSNGCSHQRSCRLAAFYHHLKFVGRNPARLPLHSPTTRVGSCQLDTPGLGISRQLLKVGAPARDLAA